MPCFNTASGMDCMQFEVRCAVTRVVMFQYRKRYGLHAINPSTSNKKGLLSFNTASGMDCMQ